VPLLEAVKGRFPNAEIGSSTLATYKPPQAKIEERNDTSLRDTTSMVKEDVLLFVGTDSLAFTNLLMTSSGTDVSKLIYCDLVFNYSQVYRYDPSADQCIHESYRTNKLLMRRYAALQRARDADIFGILIGTLGVASYLHLINRLRKMLVDKGKKPYTISVGKLNPAKLANFAEIECFVFVACPENSIIESKV
jgi:diphthamide biosynthesis protein 2